MDGWGTFWKKINTILLHVPFCHKPHKALQVKFVDDVSQVASINMKASLVPDTAARPRPLKYDERTWGQPHDYSMGPALWLLHGASILAPWGSHGAGYPTIREVSILAPLLREATFEKMLLKYEFLF